MALEEVLVSFFYMYAPLLAFIAGLAIGDLMLFLGILAGAGKINFFIILLFGFIGGLIHDILFYFIANSPTAHFIKKRFKLSKRKNKIAGFIEKIGNGHYFLPILIAKFVYGVRDAVILYVAHNNKNFKRYLLVVACADFIWMTTIVSIGWLAGQGFTAFINLFRGFEKWLFILLAGLIILYILNKSVISFILKHAKRIIKKHFIS
ncbi:MAG: hypothetical protein AABX85_03000 [Nanoarchaeota archaeon]